MTAAIRRRRIASVLAVVLAAAGASAIAAPVASATYFENLSNTRISTRSYDGITRWVYPGSHLPGVRQVLMPGGSNTSTCYKRKTTYQYNGGALRSLTLRTAAWSDVLPASDSNEFYIYSVSCVSVPV